jgi:uncharacterized protein YgiM (DUF1202 family)
MIAESVLFGRAGRTHLKQGPGGKFRVVGMIRAGTTGLVLRQHRDGWCQLDLSVPNITLTVCP